MSEKLYVTKFPQSFSESGAGIGIPAGAILHEPTDKQMAGLDAGKEYVWLMHTPTGLLVRVYKKFIEPYNPARTR